MMGMFSTSSFALKATEIFSSGINLKSALNVNSILNVNSVLDSANCIENGVDTPCSSIAGTTPRILAPYAIITAYFNAIKFNGAQKIHVKQSENKTIDPGVYKSIEVDAAGNQPGSKPGKLIMNPGLYKIDEYIVNGQVVPADTNGSVSLMVKSVVELTNSDNNCEAGTPYLQPEKFAMYIEDINPVINGACMSGYLYSKYAVNNLKIDLWGAISAESLVLDVGTNINVDLEHLIFTDFFGFLEVGPSIQPGWHMVKAPAEIDANNPVCVKDFFGDDLNVSTFRTEWRVYQRDYDEVTHRTYYTELSDLSTPLEKNRGYWVSTTKNAKLKVLGLKPVVWDHNIKGCPSKHGCYRYRLQSCSEEDTNPYLYNLVGSVASRESDWKDYRIEVENNGTLMTPTAAHKAGIMNNQIWKYSPSATGTYVTADDSGLTDSNISTIDYFSGFWVEVNCTNSIGKKIDLIVPNRI